jgi:DNA primase
MGGVSMYYPDDIVEEVRIRSDIVNIISSYIGLKKAGSNHMGLCPFHNEKTPSFSVSQSKQMYHCFGCGVGGNVYTFIMEYENYSFVEALKFLAERAGISLPEQEYSTRERQQFDLKSRLFEVNKEAARYYYYQLKAERGQAARQYLLDRGLTKEIIKAFGLGYANRYSDDIYEYLKSLGYEDDFLKQSGLVSFDEVRGGHDKFWDRIMFPIMDAGNRVVGFGGRIMGNGNPKYLNSPETTIFDKSRILYGLNQARRSRESYLLICEGYLDVMSLHQAGFTNAVAALGTAFTEHHANLLKRYTKEVMLSFDSDKAGIQAALRAIPILRDAGLSAKVVNMAPYKDPDDFVKDLGAEEYKKRIDQARNSFFFEIDMINKNLNMEDPEDKTRFANEIARKLLYFSEELERNFYLEAVAKDFSIDAILLQRLVNKLGSQAYGMTPANKKLPYQTRTKKNNDQGIVKIQRLLITWLTDDPTLYSKIRNLLQPEDFVDGLYVDVVRLIYEEYDKEQEVIPAKIISCFQSIEEQSVAASLFNAELLGEMKEADRQKALFDSIYRLKADSLDRHSLKAIEENNTVLLQKIIMEKAELKTTIMAAIR